MSAVLHKRDGSLVRSNTEDASLAWRIKELSALLEEQDQVVTDGCGVLENASKSLASVRTKFEPVKDSAAALSTTSSNAAAISEDLHKLIASLKVHQKLDRAAMRAQTDSKVAELLAAVEEMTQTNHFLLQFDNLEIAITSLARNRESMAHAADALSKVFDRIIKAHTTVPTAAMLEDVLSKPPAERPKAEDVFFSGKAREVKTLTTIMQLMVEIGERGSVQRYVASRQAAVAAMLQVIAAAVPASLPSAAHAERRIYEWSSQMRMLAQILEWEDRLARNMVPSTALADTLRAILADAVTRTVRAGEALAQGRDKRDQIFPLVDMIATMHDPYVLPSMKKAFRAQTMVSLKEEFLALLSHLCDAAAACASAFASSVGSDAVPPGKDSAAATTVAAPTAFAMRVLKCIYRQDVQDKLPFLTDPRKFASDAIRDLLAGLESKVALVLKDAAGVSVALANNLQYILANVEEHGELRDALGSTWRQKQQEQLQRHQEAYFEETWRPLVSILQQLLADAQSDGKKDTIKDLCKRLNARLEKVLTAQAPWAMPDAKLRNSITNMINNVVVSRYGEFCQMAEQTGMLKTQQKYLKYSQAEFGAIMSHLFTSAQLRPGVLKK